MSQGQPVPRPVRGRNGAFICATTEGTWLSAMAFVQGDYFAGGLESITPVGEAIGALHGRLQTVPDSLRPGRQWPRLSDVDRDVFEAVLSGGQQAIAKFSHEHQALIATNRTFLEQTWQRVLDFQTHLSAGQNGLIHIDLHPHNMLLDGNRMAAIVDFDSLMEGPLSIMVGFSCFKLLRQVVCSQGAIDDGRLRSPLVDEYLAAMVSGCGALPCDPETVVLSAYTEVCRRLAIIFKLNLIDNNSEWNHVLGIQLVGLREIQWLFGEGHTLNRESTPILLGEFLVLWRSVVVVGDVIPVVDKVAVIGRVLVDGCDHNEDGVFGPTR